MKTEKGPTAPALTAPSPALPSLSSPSPAPPSAMPANPAPGLGAPDLMALTGNSDGSNGAADNQVESEEDLRARVAGNLAMGLARILVAAIRDLESSSVQEREQLVATVQDQRQKLDAAVTALGEVRAKVEIELAQGIASLREADAHHDAVLEGLKNETQDRIDALMGRLQLQQEELATLQPKFSEISPRVASVVQRLDRQADAIKAMCETGAHREVLLDELSGVLAKLKANWNAGVKMPAEL